MLSVAPEVTMGKTVDSVESMSLLCNVQAQPQASVVIYKEDKMGGRQVFYSDNHNNSMVGIIHDPGHDITMYQLELEELDASKFGNYYCAADNMLGVDSDTVKISGGTKNLEAKQYHVTDSTTTQLKICSKAYISYI